MWALILFIPTIALAQNTKTHQSLTGGELKIVRQGPEGLILELQPPPESRSPPPSCAPLDSIADSIRLWTTKISTAPPQFKSEPAKLTPQNTCRVHLSSAIPKRIQSSLALRLYRHGANCWGTTLDALGFSERPRFAWPEEIAYWMESPLCRPLHANEALEPGDLIHVYGPEYLTQDASDSGPPIGEAWRSALEPKRVTPLSNPEATGETGYQRLFHTVTWVAPDLVYGKDSPHRDDRFRFHLLENVYARPRGDPNPCQESTPFMPHLREFGKRPSFSYQGRCRYLSKVSRCQTWPSWIRQQNLSPKQLQTLQRIRDFQKIQKDWFQYLTQPGFKPNPEHIQTVVQRANLAQQNVLRQIRNSTLGQPQFTLDEMLLALEYFTASALIKTQQWAK